MEVNLSKFSTKLPCPVTETINLLPEGKFVHEIRLSEDKQSIEIIWDSESLYSGKTFPVEFPAENIGGDLPDGIILAKDKPVPANPPQRYIHRPAPPFKWPEAKPVEQKNVNVNLIVDKPDKKSKTKSK